MNSTDLVLKVIAAFDHALVPYMLVGSFSSNFYGRPRSTKDADFVVQITNDQLFRVASEIGPAFQVENQMSFETITMTSRYIINHPQSAFKLELFLLSDDPHDQVRFTRRKQVQFENKTAYLPSVEDVIITKLRWSKGGKRAKDVEDVRKVISVQAPSLDLLYIRQWTDRHGTRELFERLLEEINRLNLSQGS